MRKRGNDWLIYGAYGYTGELVAREAVQRGHRPLLAGRSERKLRPLAEDLGLEYACVDLTDAVRLREVCSKVALVFHAAGPFVHTASPMVRACLHTGTNYVDVTGEIPVFEKNFLHDKHAGKKGIALISGVGFDVVPTDCLSAYVVGKIPNAQTLRLAFSGLGGFSRGTLKTLLAHLHEGILVRREGKLVSYDSRLDRASDFRRHLGHLTPITWGDLSTAYHSTGVPDIAVFMHFMGNWAPAARIAWSVSRRLLAVDAIRTTALGFVNRRISGPNEHTRKTARSTIWAEATNPHGESAFARLETMEAYRLTAVAGVRAVERVLATSPRGALTPSQAFGAEFAFELPQTRLITDFS
ncbi:MAG: NAD(P)H-binding protein [Chitinivibrionales bacterium]|nr:NAD(P)H-binding protein [Chitinivibrionales bacterium]